MMDASLSELGRAIDLTWRYSDAVAKGPRRLSALPASPQEIERGLSVVLAALRDPVGTRELATSFPKEATAFIDPQVPAMLESMLQALPSFVSDEDALVEIRALGALGLEAGADGTPKQLGPPDLRDLDLQAKWLEIQKRQIHEMAELLARAHSVRWRPSPASTVPVAPHKGSGCIVALGSVALTLLIVMSLAAN